MKLITRLTILAAYCLLSGHANFASAQTFTNLYSFRGTPEGADPRALLTQGSDGNFYGATVAGGTSNSGTIFRVTAAGSFTNLYSFSGGLDGQTPIGTLVQVDTNFYGTTGAGGTASNGTVFRISSTGSFTNLHLFSGADGAGPYTGLVLGGDGNFYGTTLLGGASNAGTVFRISPAGSFTNLYSFSGYPDGAGPTQPVLGSDGNFYGVTAAGGTNFVVNGGVTNIPFGTVFKITPGGSLTSLYSFAGSPDGQQPTGLTLGSDGSFYGTTRLGGTSNLGTVFRITPAGSLTNLYSFRGSPDGASPVIQPTLGSDGNIYGTTSIGGTSNKGTVYRITPAGILTNLHSFAGGLDGLTPIAGLSQGSDGNFYGMTSMGGTSNKGTLFKLSVPLDPPANQISAIQKAGTNVVVSIPSVTGESYQLQFRNSLTAGNWSNIAGAFISNSPGALITLTNFGGALQAQRFFRMEITP